MLRRTLALWTLVVPLAASCGEAPATGRGAEAASVSYEAWKRGLWREPFGERAYIVDEDIAVVSERRLAEYYRAAMARARGEELIVATHGRADVVWHGDEMRHLTYCVSEKFGAHKAAVVRAMASAARSWEAAANVKFTYLGAEDATCRGTNRSVVFDVMPLSSAPYLARSFLPDYARAQRHLVIAAKGLHPSRPLTLAGVLRHELGHVLGLRHEHTRPEAHACFEDNHWRPLTPYDRASVMHYPQCNGTGNWAATLTHYDKEGIAELYGRPSGR